jgi:hypothetical protein
MLIKTCKENKLEPSWEEPFLILLTMETAVQTVERGWTHHTRVKRVPHLTRRNNGLCSHIQTTPEHARSFLVENLHPSSRSKDILLL